MIFFTHKLYHNGFTLVETLIAILIFSTALVSLMAIASRGISATITAQQQISAQYLAQEGLEVVRNIRDSNFISGVAWDTGLINCSLGSPCTVEYGTSQVPPNLVSCSGCEVLQDVNGFFTANAVNPSGFFREIVLTPQGPTEYLVTSRVTWNTKGLERNVTLQTLLTNWQN